MAESIGQKIKRTREAKGLSQRDLAKLVGVSQQTVAHWEQGGTPRLPKQRRIAEVLEWNKPDPALYSVDRPRLQLPSDSTTTVRYERELAPDPIADDEINTIKQRIKEIHQQHAEYQRTEEERMRKEWGERAPKTIVISMDTKVQNELRLLQRGLFERVLHRLGAQGRPEANIVLGSFNRRYDYLSNKVIAEVVEVMYPHQRRLHSDMRHAAEILNLAVARAQRPELIPLLIVVSEIAHVEELRMLMHRTEFDAMNLGVSVRFAESYAEAAEVIVATERAAPIVGNLNATEEPDTLQAHATVSPGPGSVGIFGQPPEVTIAPADDPDPGSG